MTTLPTAPAWPRQRHALTRDFAGCTLFSATVHGAGKRCARYGKHASLAPPVIDFRFLPLLYYRHFTGRMSREAILCGGVVQLV